MLAKIAELDEQFKKWEPSPLTVAIFLAIFTPPFMYWLIGPSVVGDYWTKDARARVVQLGDANAAINVELPCRGWSTFGFSVDYQLVQARPRRGYLCRKFGGDADWTWYPQ
jgi:hypothetical protein